MQRKLLLASIALNVLAVFAFALLRPPSAFSATSSMAPSYSSMAGISAVTRAPLNCGPIGLAAFGMEHKALGAFSALADLIGRESAAGFLVGALLLGIATSLRLRVIRKHESDPGLQS